MVNNKQEKKNRVVVYATGGASNNSELDRERETIIMPRTQKPLKHFWSS